VIAVLQAEVVRELMAWTLRPSLLCLYVTWRLPEIGYYPREASEAVMFAAVTERRLASYLPPIPPVESHVDSEHRMGNAVSIRGIDSERVWTKRDLGGGAGGEGLQVECKTCS
jgi:hypothetical protein